MLDLTFILSFTIRSVSEFFSMSAFSDDREMYIPVFVGMATIAFFLVLTFMLRRNRHINLLMRREEIPEAENSENDPLSEQLTDEPLYADSVTENDADYSGDAPEVARQSEVSPSADPSAPAVGPNGLSRSKAEEIWGQIMHEMEDNRIFTDTSVTRDNFSERIGCNHTWFSQVIREKTGLSYPNFMNQRRVHEAMKMLAEPSLKISMKQLSSSLGFLTPSTFYIAFRKIAGMSPADYRKKMMETLSDESGEVK